MRSFEIGKEGNYTHKQNRFKITIVSKHERKNGGKAGDSAGKHHSEMHRFSSCPVHKYAEEVAGKLHHTGYSEIDIQVTAKFSNMEC